MNPMTSPTKEEVRRNYDAFAPKFDLAEGLPELLGVKNLRRRLLERASGDILEVGVGTGKNLRYYPSSCSITAVDLSQGMMKIARRLAHRLGLQVAFQVMDAEALAFPDCSFDTVVDSLNLCTFVDPLRALREIARVCRPGGRILLLEHGRSDRGWLGRWQDRRADRHAARLGCRWNLEPLDLLARAGLPVVEARRNFFGIFYEIEARPLAPS